MSNWQRESSLAGAFALIAGIAYGFLLQPGSIPFSRHSDIVAQHLAMKEVAHRSWQAGDGLPFWKSDLLGGTPALTHPQALFTNPLQSLYLWMEPANATGPTLWLHLLVMALSMSVLGRALGLGPWARLAMGVAGLFSFKLILITYAGWLPVLPMFVCLPLFFAANLRALDQPGWGTASALAASAILCLHAGHLQLFYYSLLLLSPYVAFRLIRDLATRRMTHARDVALVFGTSALVAAMACAYLLVPLAAEAPLTSRVDASYEFVVARPAFSTRHLTTFLAPEILGTPLNDSYLQTELWEDVAYFGIVAEALALIGIVLARRRRHVVFLSLAFAASIGLALHGPLSRLLYDFAPGYSLFRGPNRFLFLTTILGIGLMGTAIDELSRRLNRHDAPRWLAAAAMGLALFAITAEGTYYAHRYLSVSPIDRVLPQTRYRSFFDADPTTFRIAPISRYAINYGWAAPMGLELITGFDAYNLRHYQEYMSLLVFGRPSRRKAPVWTDVERITRWDMLDDLNVKYLVSPRPFGRVPAAVRLRSRLNNEPMFLFYKGLAEGPLYIYENTAFRERAFWAPRVVWASDHRNAIERVHDGDLRRMTIVEDDSGAPRDAAVTPDRAPGNSDDSVDVDTRSGRLSAKTRSANRRFLVFSEVWHPGWRARVDGTDARILQANVALMGLWVPAGEHLVELEFEPLHWRGSLAASAIGAGGLLALLAGAASRRAR